MKTPEQIWLKRLAAVTLLLSLGALSGLASGLSPDDKPKDKETPDNPPGKPAPEQPAAAKLKLDIRPDPKAEWGASLADVQKVLDSAGHELYRHFPGRPVKPILVEPKGGPITLYKRGPQGEYRVKLNTGNTYWAQYAYQFSHELGHILCEYEEENHRNKWFEESICELASLFSLRAMAGSWRTAPPYPNWKSYSAALTNYADERLKKATLPQGQTLGVWYAANAEALYANATDREKNSLVAAALLDLFEKEPEQWPAVGYLNVIKATPKTTFTEHLAAWRKNCPEKHRAFVDKIIGRFSLPLN